MNNVNLPLLYPVLKFYHVCDITVDTLYYKIKYKHTSALFSTRIFLM